MSTAIFLPDNSDKLILDIDALHLSWRNLFNMRIPISYLFVLISVFRCYLLLCIICYYIYYSSIFYKIKLIRNDNIIRNIVYERQTHATRQWLSQEVKQKNNKSSHKRSHSKGSKYIANVKKLYPKVQVQVEYPLQEVPSILLTHLSNGEKTK